MSNAVYADFDRVRAYYRAEGFLLGLMKCRKCKALYEAFVHPGAPMARLECRYCGVQDSYFSMLDAIPLGRREPPALPPPLPTIR